MNSPAPNNTYKLNDYVMYRQNGICRIDDIRTESFSGATKEYYVLKSVCDDRMQIFVPTDSSPLLAHMRPLLTKAEILSVIERSEAFDELWIAEGKPRATHFEELLRSGESVQVLWVFKMLSLYRQKRIDEKKKFYASDERILALAEKMITEEFAFVLNIDRDAVIPFVLEHLPKENP